MAGIQIPVSATFNSGNVDAQIKQMQARFNELGKSAASLGDVKFDPISNATAKEMQAMNARFSAMLNNAKQLRQTLANTGQSGKNWHEVDWKQVFPNDYQRNRYAHTLANTLRPGSAEFTQGGPTTKPPWHAPSAPGGGSAHPGGGNNRPQPPQGGGGGQPAAGPGAMGMVGTAGGNLGKTLMRGVLPLAGIMGVMSMAGRAVDLAREEAVEHDKLLRGTGDLNNEFDRLRTSVRMAGEGLGATYTESAALARSYAQTANASDAGNIGENVRSGMGMSRAYGLDLEQGVGFMGTMRHYQGMDPGDQNGRRLAILIAEAIERGQATAKAGEMLSAIANYTSTIARQTLTPPNVEGFAGALSGLTATGTAGLGPSEAANLLMSADAAVRQGGGMGESGLNFTFGALRRENPGLDPVTSMAIAEQGLFGSGQSLGRSPFGEYMQRNGRSMPALSGRENFTVLREQINQQYDDPGIRLDAIRNYFGLNSLQHAAAFSNMEPEQLGSLEGLLNRSGIDMNSVSASGIQNLGAVGAASGNRLRGYASQVMGREDITDLERRRIQGALDSGDDENIREELARIVAVYEQEQNVATETRDGVAELNNTLTAIGSGLLPVVSGIQQGVNALVNAAAPESEYAREIRMERGYERFKREREDLYSEHGRESLLQQANAEKLGIPDSRLIPQEEMLRRLQAQEMREFETKNHDYVEYERELKDRERRRGPAEEALDSINDRQRRSRSGEPLQLDAPSTPSEDANRNGGSMRVGNIELSDEEMAALDEVSGGDDRKKRFLMSVLAIENRGFGRANNKAVSPAGAKGAFQIMPKTARAFDVQNPLDFGDSAAGMGRYYDELNERFGGRQDVMAANYNGGEAASNALLAGGRAPAKETRDYLRMFREIMPGLRDGGDLPAGAPPPNRQQEVKVVVESQGRLYDQAGSEVGEISAPTVRQSLPIASGAN